MIQEFCNQLKQIIIAANLPFTENIAGVVKAVSYEIEQYNDNNELMFMRPAVMPVSWDTNKPQDYATQYRDLVPDSSKKGVLYFEDGGVSMLKQTVYGAAYSGNITLVCWYNKELIENKVNSFVQSSYITQINEALHMNKNFFNLAPLFSRVRLQLNRIQANDAGVFSKYTYEETDRQYLMLPYEYFALDIKALFTVSPACLNYAVAPSMPAKPVTIVV